MSSCAIGLHDFLGLRFEMPSETEEITLGWKGEQHVIENTCYIRRELDKIHLIASVYFFS